MNRWLFLILATTTKTTMTAPIIKRICNIDTPVCKSCRHFIPTDYDVNSRLGKCDMFGTKDIITGDCSLDYAETCRNDEAKCGHEGKYYELEKNLGFKYFKYRVQNNQIIIYSLCLSILYIIVFAKYSSRI